MADFTVEEATAILDRLQLVRVSSPWADPADKLNKFRVSYSTFKVRFSDVLPLLSQLNIHLVVSLALLVSESLSVDGFHPVDPVVIKVTDWACVFTDEVS